MKSSAKPTQLGHKPRSAWPPPGPQQSRLQPELLGGAGNKALRLQVTQGARIRARADPRRHQACAPPTPPGLAPWPVAGRVVGEPALEESGRAHFTSWLCLLWVMEFLANYGTSLSLSFITFKMDISIPVSKESWG